MCFGRGRLLEDGLEKRTMFEAMTSRYIPGRTAGRDYAPATEEQLATTAVIEVFIEKMSAKMREGDPRGPNDEAEDGFGTRGVVELHGNGE
jgi:hypothetical protein